MLKHKIPTGNKAPLRNYIRAQLKLLVVLYRLPKSKISSLRVGQLDRESESMWQMNHSDLIIKRDISIGKSIKVKNQIIQTSFLFEETIEKSDSLFDFTFTEI